MNYRVVWSDKASDQLDYLEAYLRLEAPAYADKIIDGILNAPDKLTDFPKLGMVELTLDEELEYRYLVYNHWKIVYMVQQYEIIIVSLFDTRQNPLKIWEGIQRR